jgi:UDPglucose--hexose-1-phosphate uridylyltransferase
MVNIERENLAFSIDAEDAFLENSARPRANLAGRALVMDSPTENHMENPTENPAAIAEARYVYLDQPHRRFNLLTGEWVLVSPHRTQRPWQGKVESLSPDDRPSYDPHCYLCPGNERAGGVKNPSYDHTFVFTNDFAALMPRSPSPPSSPESGTGLLRWEPSAGTCRVICFSPRHDLTLPEMESSDVRRVVNLWAEQYEELSAQYAWVQIFENKGALMGCSNPHPHGQIWAGSFLPNEPAKEEAEQARYFAGHGRQLLADYLEEELREDRRLVEENEHWVALTPWWAVWPFELLLLPRRAVGSLPELNDPERDALADILRKTLTRYDNLFEISFPYSMGWHGRPRGSEPENRWPHWRLHAHFYPPLLRSATVRKFLVGYEMLAEAQRDITAEQAASRLRDCSTAHYKQRREG